MRKPTTEEIANNKELWSTYVDPDNQDPTAFETMTAEEKIAMIRDLWPERERELDEN